MFHKPNDDFYLTNKHFKFSNTYLFLTCQPATSEWPTSSNPWQFEATQNLQSSIMVTFGMYVLVYTSSIQIYHLNLYWFTVLPWQAVILIHLSLNENTAMF